MEGRATIEGEINSTFPDNNSKFITAEKVRAFMDIINESKFNLKDDNLGNFLLDNGSGQQVTLSSLISRIRRETLPLFWLEMVIDGEGSPNIISWTSNNPTLNLVQNDPLNTQTRSQVIVTYSNFYGASSVRAGSTYNRDSIIPNITGNEPFPGISNSSGNFTFGASRILPHFNVSNTPSVVNENGIPLEPTTRRRIYFFDTSNLPLTIADF